MNHNEVLSAAKSASLAPKVVTVWRRCSDNSLFIAEDPKGNGMIQRDAVFHNGSPIKVVNGQPFDSGTPDYRGKKVRFVKVDTDLMIDPFLEEDDPEAARACLGQVGIAQSARIDGELDEEGTYMVTFPNGRELTLMASELELAE